ncbi:putative pentatricopeptide repeat-containing protein At5g40405 [Phoenix dactylifera]|uniref:Pentatricopeptide repeat-containing protein At5g40405 n=1 Tax=Phoenix dactylifera TaxID=42345 RepID=A0A8B7CF67_PHODC|nr:putative pentatricopeptide repeat-containing protein At5g40405 [Phoenix dactylifera]
MRSGLSCRCSPFSSNARLSLRRSSTAPHHPILSLVPTSPSFPQLLQAHAQLVVRGLTASRAAMAHLLAHCALCTSAPPHYFHAIYARIDRPNVFAANNLLRCLARSAAPSDSLLFYSRSRRAGVLTNNYTFPFLLQACSRTPVVAEGAQVHAHVVKLGFDGDLYVRNALIHFYSSCCEMDESERVFNEFPERRDVVSWNAMLAGYARTGRIDVAEELFEGMPERDAISWSTMIMGYVQGGILEKGLKLFREMVDKGEMVNEAALVTVLSASAQLGLLENGQFIHSNIKARNFPITLAVGTALVDMYAKCGSIKLSKQVFDGMPQRDVFAWNAMVCGLATHGMGKEALELFQRFLNEGLRPTSVTFVGVLNACSRAGLVAEGRQYFKSMIEDYGIEPEMEHYGCIVDLLGRAGLVSEALELIEGMSVSPDPVLWGTLLGACKIHGLLDLGITIGNKLVELDPSHDGHYVLLAGIYAKARKWEDVIRVRRLMSNRGTNKVAGWSLIEAHGSVHKFVAGDREHKDSSEVYMTLEMIGRRLGEAGYMPDVSSVLHDIGDEEKVHAITEHSERLAIAFGMMVVDADLPIRIVKNLRVCGDCHEFSKMVTKVFGREIVMRDGSRFHHFKEGNCSCLDYW